MSDLSERHHEHRGECAANCRGEDGFPQPWPCDTALETARADKAEAALARCRDEFTRQNDCSHSECIDRLHAAIQQRDTLAEALRLIADSPQTLDSRVRNAARAALDAIREDE